MIELCEDCLIKALRLGQLFPEDEIRLVLPRYCDECSAERKHNEAQKAEEGL